MAVVLHSCVTLLYNVLHKALLLLAAVLLPPPTFLSTFRAHAVGPCRRCATVGNMVIGEKGIVEPCGVYGFRWLYVGKQAFTPFTFLLFFLGTMHGPYEPHGHLGPP